MGEQVKNIIVGPHLSLGGAFDGFQVSLNRGTPCVHNASPLITSAAVWVSLIGSAHQSEAAFIAAATQTAIGGWLAGLSPVARAGVAAAMAALPAAGWVNP